MSGIYEPEFYDYVTPKSFRGDAEWYRRKAMESGGPVLELGAGTGRITIPIAEDGLSIYALDSDEGMRKALQLKVDMLPEDVRKRIVIVDDDMRSFRLNQEFGLIIAPFRAFLHNLTPEDQKACLQSVYEHLRPGSKARTAFWRYISNAVGITSGTLPSNSVTSISYTLISPCRPRSMRESWTGRIWTSIIGFTLTTQWNAWIRMNMSRTRCAWDTLRT
jgi:phospholipid N-methyltransferase